MKKKITMIIITLLIIAGVLTGVYYYLNKPDNNTLTILEKEWIENNKNNRIDLAIENDVPIFTLDGEGLIYNFIKDFEKNTELEFNKISNDSKSDYKIEFTDKVENNDILIYKDNYALVTDTNLKINSVDDLKNVTIGFMKTDNVSILKYAYNKKLSYTPYETYDELFEALEEKKVNGIIVPKLMYLNEIIEGNYYVAYNITEMTNNLVMKLGKENKLNSIIKKYYKKWNDEKYQEEFNTSFLNNYYESSNVDDDTKVKFNSKRYKYGFVVNPPYDELIDNKLVGINSEIIKSFSNLSNIEVTYNEFNSYSDLIRAFNENKIDFFLNVTSMDKFDMDAVSTSSISKERIAIISHNDNNITINSIASLDKEKVSSITNSQIMSYLEENKIETKKYNNVSDLLDKINKKSVIALDIDTYNIYKSSILKDYKIDYDFYLPTDFVYTMRDIKDNKLFNDLFTFYISFINEREFANKINYSIFENANKLAFIKPLCYSIFAIIVLVIITIIVRKIKKSKKDTTGVSKENKLRYIDMLTSLKNRNYLNDSIEKWDEAEIYPQAIIIIDLNNIAYINDNYGHSEGDNVITEAANILIKNQLEQSEIIRTNGNEFLIYMVNYEEKQVVSYIKKLSKEFKELEHGFGAALGYSMINDGLKTVDDAINEATLDMRANKEEANE